MDPNRLTRRRFTRTLLAAAGAVTATPTLLRGQNLNQKLNIAIIGAGGRGASNLQSVASENIVALCDVNSKNLAAAAAKHSGAQQFTDFRRLFERAQDFDAVVVSTCEHTHAFATMLALRHSKHVYCEKPLTHNIWGGTPHPRDGCQNKGGDADGHPSPRHRELPACGRTRAKWRDRP